MPVDYRSYTADECDFVPVAAVGDVPPGERLFFTVRDLDVVLFNIGGQFFAIEDRCTHDDGPLGDGVLEGTTIVCPRHGARFDVRTGRVLSPPAPAPVPAFPVRVRDGQIEVGIPRSR